MKKVFNLSFSLALATFVGCNEKISPNLQTSNSTSGPTSPTAADVVYSFKLSNNQVDTYNFHLHKSGAGNRVADCEIKTTNLPFDRDLFVAAGTSGNEEFDITCLLEAEELSLYYSGLKFKIEASANTCNYISYTPFGYYNRMPGDSSGSYSQVVCNEGYDPAAVATQISGLGSNLQENPGTPIGCGEWVSNTLPLSSRSAFYAENDAELCRFNYSNGQSEKCDTGVISVTKYTFTTTTVGTTQVTSYVPSTRTITCGGKTNSCIKGPIKSHSELSNSSRGSLVTNMTLDTPGEVSYSYPALMSDLRAGNFVYANFRRDLAHPDIALVNRMDAGYVDSFLDHKTIDPLLMESYSRAKSYNNLTNPVTYYTAPYSSSSYLVSNLYLTEGGRFSAKPLAAEPFMGIGQSQYINPFYTFECLDHSREVKGRIRLLVREWDRIFPMSTDLKPNETVELISDVYKQLTLPSASPRMDVGFLMFRDPLRDIDEPNSGNGDWDSYNDYPDWDDILSMRRQTDYPTIPLVFRPYSDFTGTTLDYFDHSAFPNEGVTE